MKHVILYWTIIAAIALLFTIATYFDSKLFYLAIIVISYVLGNVSANSRLKYKK